MSVRSPINVDNDNIKSSFNSDNMKRINANEFSDTQFEYPDIELDDYTKLWSDNTIDALKEDSSDTMKNMKDQILAGTGSLAVTLALILTIAIPAMIQNPCQSTARQFRHTNMCEAYHIIGWATTMTACFIGILNATNLYAQAMYTPPNQRGVNVLLSFPHILEDGMQ